MDINALFTIQCGLFIAAVEQDGRLNGCVTNTLMEQSHVPLKLSLTIDKTHLTHEMAVKKGSIGVSVLSRTVPVELIKKFGFVSGRDADKFAGFDGYTLDVNGNPVLTGPEIAAVFSLNIIDTIDVGSHTIFLCEAADMKATGGSAITYADYRSSLKK